MGRAAVRGSSDAVGQAAARLLARGENLEPRIVQPYVPPLSEWRHNLVSPKQAAFLGPVATLYREGYYGGAVGGGKTEALLLGALQYVDVPGYAAVLVRQTFPMLSQPGGLIPRSKEWLIETDAVYNESRHEWTFPSGATLTFKHLENEAAVQDYQGGEYAYVGIDEVTDFSEEQYQFLFSRRRARLGVDVPLRTRAASNPVGPGRDWVYKRFILGGREAGRLVVLARLEDNPGLDTEEYELSLRELGAVAYQQLRYGDWEVRPEGRMFKARWFEIVPASDVPSDVRHVRYWDLAATETPQGRAARKFKDPDWTAGLLLARSSQGVYYVDDVERFRAEGAGVERRIAATAGTDGRDVPIRIEEEPGSAGKALVSHYRRDILDGFDVRGVRPTGSKETRARPVAARVEAGEVKLVRGAWVDAFLDELTEFPEGLHDDQVDALSGAYEFLARPRVPDRPAAPTGIRRSSPWRNA